MTAPFLMRFALNCHPAKEQGLPNPVNKERGKLDKEHGGILVFISCIHCGAAFGASRRRFIYRSRRRTRGAFGASVAPISALES
jgi:hypothetical protein